MLVLFMHQSIAAFISELIPSPLEFSALIATILAPIATPLIVLLATTIPET